MAPNNPRISPDFIRLVEVLAFNDVQLLDLAGASQVFVAANEIATKNSMSAPYRLRVVATGGPGVRATSGLFLTTEPLSVAEDVPDTLLVVGGQGVIRGTGLAICPAILGY